MNSLRLFGWVKTSLHLTCFLLSFLFASNLKIVAQSTIDFENTLVPLMDIHCYDCHHNGNSKGGVNLKNYQEKGRAVKDGELWLKVLEQIKIRNMPPDSERPLTESEYMTLVQGIDDMLKEALEKSNPGQTVVRRLSHWEYQYTIEDLLGVTFNARAYFPSDGSGGGGFDNQSKALFMTPLKLERYYEAATIIVKKLSEDRSLWKKIVPEEYKITWWQKFISWFKSLFSKNNQASDTPELAANKIIHPLVSRAFRRFLTAEEKEKMSGLFLHVYSNLDSLESPQRFDEGIKEVIKAMLVSPNFLYRVEEENELEDPYPVGDFELASRLSYFLWSSLPDQELFELARNEKLHDTLVLEQQVRRMLGDDKVKRFSEIFVSQWLGITKLMEPDPVVDPERFPEFNQDLKNAMYEETVAYFHHVLTESKNFMELINSNYTFLNDDLAAFYGMDPVVGKNLRKVTITDGNRGGILGMGSVLTTTSLPTRTSPVLRGKWVLEEILGQPPPPPPPNVGDLPDDEKVLKDLGLRVLLETHRSQPDCKSCHEKMDPLGLGLENFDAIGRWRTSYGGLAVVDASGFLSDGTAFTGPAELKKWLSTRREAFARNISSKMLSYAIGRSILFTDETILRELESCLIENNFNTEKFIIELVKSYPFRLKINDFEKRSNEI